MSQVHILVYRRGKQDNIHGRYILLNKICYVTTISMSIDAFFIPQLHYLAENGFDVTVVCSPDEGLQERLGPTIRYVPIIIPRGISIIGTVKAIHALTSFFREEKFDLIQYSTPNAAFCASIGAKRAKCKVRNYHMMGFRYLGSTGIGRTILKTLDTLACRCSTHIECVSESNLQLGIKEKVFPAEKAVVVWNGSSGGVDLCRFDYSKRGEWRKAVRSELGFSDHDFVFGFAGRICRDKGINELLDAFFGLKNDAKLLFVGVIEDRESLNSELLDKAMNSPNVVFHEFVSDIERYYAAMDVLVLPSYREGFGMVVAEAAATGTPAIVSNIPGPIDTIEDGVTALTVEPSNPADLKAKMQTIINADYEQIGEAAHTFIEMRFDSKALNEKILERKRMLLGN